VTEFSFKTFQNEYLPEGGREVNAIVTVSSTGGPTSAPVPAVDSARASEVIMIDCSSSMNYPRDKINAAKQATAAAIDVLRDGVGFAVIAGTDLADMVYPSTHELVELDSRTRTMAKAAVGQLQAKGGTAIGQWLTLANQLFDTRPADVRHALLLTDGKNEHETAERLDATLADCQGRFTCDCRGVGTDWQVDELRKISTALLGSVDIVADPAGLEADFRAITAMSMAKDVGDVRLRIWTPKGADIRFVKQVAPTVLDLTERRNVPDPEKPLIGEYPTGSWGTESRDYHVCVEVRTGQVGDEMLAARVSLVGPDGTTLGQGLVRAVWTDDAALSTKINKEVAHYSGQAELADAIQQGLEARRSGDVDTATAKLGRAVQLAAQSGHGDTARLLAKVVDVVDERSGTVRLRSGVTAVDEMTLDTRSTRTARVRGT
jgi:von Willebrand factor type A C-terminal domain/von Willebrand factor type A domain